MVKKSVSTKTRCNYCKRSTSATIVANNKAYCSKFCAALKLILEVDKEDQIMDDIRSMDFLMEHLLHEGPLPLPIKVRFSDLDDMDNVDLVLNSAPEGYAALIVQIADSGTPDWEPPRLCAISGSSKTARSHAGA